MDSNFRNACRGVLRRRSALALIAGAAMAVASIAGSAPAAHAQTVINVTVGNDPGTSSSGATGGPGTLSAALAQVNASTPPGGFIINLQTNVTLSGPLSPIFNSVTINGGGFTISGNNTTRIFMIGVDSATQTSAAVAGSIIAQRPQVMISNVALSSGLAQGGFGASGGGGGMGAGAALFVNQSADVTLSGVTFTGNKATGGSGGSSPTPAGGGGGLGGVGGVYVGVGAGGGGGMFGNAIINSANLSGGGAGLFGGGGGAIGFCGSGGAGGGGYTGNGGNAGSSNGQNGTLAIAGLSGGGGNAGAGGGTGGSTGGGGAGTPCGSGGGGGGGGGFAGANGAAGVGGNGGFGGGGGGGAGASGGNGGFGGGGGGIGGSGGFGGGGGGSGGGGNGGFGGGGGGGGNGGFGGGAGAGGTSGFGAGTVAGSAILPRGDGGAAMGGAIFLMAGGTLTISGAGVVSDGTVTGGEGRRNGSGFGSGLFLQGGNVSVIFAPGGGQTYVVSDVIADQSGSGGTGANAGVGSLVKTGAGTLVLAGANTYSGGTTLAAGTLTLANNQALGTGALTTTGSVVDYANGVTIANPIIVNSNMTQLQVTDGTATQAGVISELNGPRPLEKIGAGTLVLTAANTYTGPTTITAGTLQLGNGGTSGSLAGNVVNNGMFAINRSDTFTFGGAISGSGAFQQNGAGTTILTAANTYTGATAVNAGTLQAGAANVFASGSAFTVASGATLNLASFNQTIGSLAGAGSVTPGSATLTTGNDNSSTTFSGTISGTGGLTKIGSGVLTLSGANTYSGGTTLAAGTLRLASNQALGTGALTTTGSVVDYASGVTIANPVIINSNTTQFQVTDGTATQAGVISELNGPRPIEKIGAGTLVLGAVNTYSAPTSITVGTLAVAADSNLGNSAGGLIFGGGTLQFLSGFTSNRAVTLNAGGGTVDTNGNDATLGGAISGIGSFTKIGGGTLTLAGASSYSGATAVNAGTLLLSGSIANSAVTVNSGALLAGPGTVGVTTINSGGMLAPGPTSTPGSMTVQGNLAFQSGALYLVQVTPSATSSANATGNATLAGTVLAAFAPGSYMARNYTILSASGGVNGAFNALTTANLPAGFAASLSYTPTSALLNLTATLGGGGGAGGGLAALPLSINQRNVANALNNFFNAGNALPPAFVNIFGLTGTNLANALTLLSGEAATGAQQGAFQLTNQFLGIMLDPFVDGRTALGGSDPAPLGFAPEREPLPDDIALAYAKVLKAPPKPPIFEQRWGVWGAGYGGTNGTSGDPAVVGSHDLAARTAGGTAGLDYHLTRDTVVGFALAGGGTDWSLAQGLGGGKSDAFQAGVYGATRWGPAYLAAAFAYTNHWMSTDRFAFAGDHLSASFNAQSFGGRLEGGYRFGTFYGGLTPYAAIQAQNFRTPGYSETDLTNGGFALSYNSRTATDTRSELGARFDNQMRLDPHRVLALRARLAWAHDWISDPTLAAVFQTLPGASFIVNGATPAKNSALTSAGAELRLANGVSLLAKFDGEFASHSSTYAGTGTVRYTW